MAGNLSNLALVPIHVHNTDSVTDPESTLLPLLHPHLPYSLSVYRRIQFPSHEPHAHILATIAQSPAEKSEQKQDVTACIAAAYIDRSRRPETDAWIFLAWDNPSHASATDTCTCETLLASLLHHAANAVPFPPLSAEDEADALAAVAADTAGDAAKKFHGHSANAAAYLTDLHNAAVLKVGALHARSAPVLDARGWLRRDKPGLDYVYRKYYFPAATVDRDCAAPPGLRWGTITRDADISLVRSRTAIPRKHRTLKMLPSAGLYPVDGGEDALPVAWAFLGLDGSLISLHVEPEYRGRGLAKAVGRKLFREGFAPFGDALGGLAHADVLVENKESNGVCLSLGGIDGWLEYWVRVDLDKVRESFDA